MLQVITDGWIDHNGYMTLNRQAVDGLGAGNLLLHTGLYYVALARAKLLTPELCEAYTKTVRLSEVTPHKGLYWRSIYKVGENQQHDDYIGIAAAAYFYDQGIAQDIVTHGSKHKWCYNSTHPETFDLTLLHDRFPGQIAFYRMSAGETLSLWEALPIAIRALIMSYSPNGDSAIHSYLMFSVGNDAMTLLFKPLWWVSGFRRVIGPKFKPYLGEGHPLNEISK